MENVPFVVATDAAYVFAGSMHVGGGLANVVVRAALPSVAGHGVSPVIDAPGGGIVITTGGEVTPLLVESVVVVKLPIEFATLANFDEALWPSNVIARINNGSAARPTHPNTM